MSTPYEAVEPRLPHHRVDGAPGLPPLILGPSLGTSLAVWDPQVPALARGHRVIRWDLPGHGGTPASLLPEDGTVEDLARAVLALADALGAERFAYAGISSAAPWGPGSRSTTPNGSPRSRSCARPRTSETLTAGVNAPAW